MSYTRKPVLNPQTDQDPSTTRVSNVPFERNGLSQNGSLWHLLANFLCGTLSQVRLGGSVSSPWVDSGIAQGRILSPLLFNMLIDSLAVTLRSAIPGVSLATSDSFRLVCQLYADDLVVLAASQADLQMALDAMPGVFAGLSDLVSAAPNPPL